MGQVAMTDSQVWIKINIYFKESSVFLLERKERREEREKREEREEKERRKREERERRERKRK